jgi:NADPH2:quinone reductase
VLFGAAELSSAKWGLLSKLNFARKMGLLMPIELMMRSKSIMGVNMLKIADNRPNTMTICLKEVMQLYRNGVFYPQVGGIFPSDELYKAHSILESGMSTGKLTVKW